MNLELGGGGTDDVDEIIIVAMIIMTVVMRMMMVMTVGMRVDENVDGAGDDDDWVDGADGSDIARFGSYLMQCAAVITQFSAIRDPPQVCLHSPLLSYWREI